MLRHQHVSTLQGCRKERKKNKHGKIFKKDFVAKAWNMRTWRSKYVSSICIKASKLSKIMFRIFLKGIT